MAPDARRCVAFELVSVAALYAVVAAEILSTYWRRPAAELYNVSGSGLEGGASRVLVFGNFPAALASLAVALLLCGLLRGRALRAAALAGAVLCGAVLWPGVVRQSDLDARPVNAVAAAGLGVVAALAVVELRRERPWSVRRQPGDRLRVALAAVLAVAAVPWLGADLAVSFDGVPVLGTLYQTGELRSQPGEAGLHPAVHHGHHHGMDGLLLVLTALLLSRTLAALERGRLRALLAGYLALMLCYGLANMANDFWLEQVVKRGWTAWTVPSFTEPKPGAPWALLVLATLALWLLWRRADRAGARVPAGE